MAIDKAIDSAALDEKLTRIANAIRAKGWESESLSFPSGFVTAINGITVLPSNVQSISGKLDIVTGGTKYFFDCGFEPDLVVISPNVTSTINGETVEGVLSFPFYQSKKLNQYYIESTARYSDEGYYVAGAKKIDVGFTYYVHRFENGEEINSNISFDWTAIKYSS